MRYICQLDYPHIPYHTNTAHPERAGKVDVSNAPYLYCDISVVDAERRGGDRPTYYHLFSRKRG